MKLFVNVFVGFGRFVTPRTLLVHFGPGGHTVDGDVDQFSWLSMVDYHIDVVENIEPDFIEPLKMVRINIMNGSVLFSFELSLEHMLVFAAFMNDTIYVHI